MDITIIIEAAITLIIGIITYFVIPIIKSKITAVQWGNLTAFAECAVKAAEAIYVGTKLGKDKRIYVIEQLKSLCEDNGYKFSEDEIRIALENAWKNMTDGIKTEG